MFFLFVLVYQYFRLGYYIYQVVTKFEKDSNHGIFDHLWKPRRSSNNIMLNLFTRLSMISVNEIALVMKSFIV